MNAGWRQDGDSSDVVTLSLVTGGLQPGLGEEMGVCHYNGSTADPLLLTTAVLAFRYCLIVCLGAGINRK